MSLSKEARETLERIMNGKLYTPYSALQHACKEALEIDEQKDTGGVYKAMYDALLKENESRAKERAESRDKTREYVNRLEAERNSAKEAQSKLSNSLNEAHTKIFNLSRGNKAGLSDAAKTVIATLTTNNSVPAGSLYLSDIISAVKELLAGYNTTAGKGDLTSTEISAGTARIIDNLANGCYPHTEKLQAAVLELRRAYIALSTQTSTSAEVGKVNKEYLDAIAMAKETIEKQVIKINELKAKYAHAHAQSIKRGEQLDSFLTSEKHNAGTIADLRRQVERLQAYIASLDLSLSTATVKNADLSTLFTAQAKRITTLESEIASYQFKEGAYKPGKGGTVYGSSIAVVGDKSGPELVRRAPKVVITDRDRLKGIWKNYTTGGAVELAAQMIVKGLAEVAELQKAKFQYEKAGALAREAYARYRTAPFGFDEVERKALVAAQKCLVDTRKVWEDLKNKK